MPGNSKRFLEIFNVRNRRTIQIGIAVTMGTKVLKQDNGITNHSQDCGCSGIQSPFLLSVGCAFQKITEM